MTQTPSIGRPPEAFSRRILLMVTGRTPQVVTETLYALAVRQDPTCMSCPDHHRIGDGRSILPDPSVATLAIDGVKQRDSDAT